MKMNHKLSARERGDYSLNQCWMIHYVIKVLLIGSHRQLKEWYLEKKL